LNHQAWVVAVAFSPDGNLAASAGLDGTVRVFETATTREVARVKKKALAIAFSSDSRQLISVAPGSNEKMAEATHTIVSFPALIDRACANVTRNLTKEEWKHYLPGEPYRATCPNLPPGQ
jgi:WD domain, G-beta repeat